MILPVEHFYTITHFKHILLIHIAYAQELMGTAKEALQRSFPGQHTVSLAAKWANILQYFRKLKLFLPKRSAPIKVSAEDLEKLRTWTNNCARAVWQRLFLQQITMNKTGKFFHIIFILINKQGDRNHLGVNQSKTIIKLTMLIKLKVT